VSHPHPPAPKPMDEHRTIRFASRAFLDPTSPTLPAGPCVPAGISYSAASELALREEVQVHVEKIREGDVRDFG